MAASVRRILAVELRDELRAIVREPSAIGFSVLMPVAFFALFVGVFGGEGDTPTEVGTAMLATFGTFGALSVTLMNPGIGLAADRERGWLRVKHRHRSPLPVTVAAKVLAAVPYTVGVLVAMTATAAAMGRLDVTAPGVLRMVAVLVVGATAFVPLGLAVGALGSITGTAAILNAVLDPHGDRLRPVDALRGAARLDRHAGAGPAGLPPVRARPGAAGRHWRVGARAGPAGHAGRGCRDAIAGVSSRSTMTVAAPPPATTTRRTQWWWLGFLSIVVFQPSFDPDATTSDWVLAGAIAVGYVPLYLYGERCQGQRRLWVVSATLVLGMVFTPFNSGAAVLFIYAAAFSGWIEPPAVGAPLDGGLLRAAGRCGAVLVGAVPVQRAGLRHPAGAGLDRRPEHHGRGRARSRVRAAAGRGRTRGAPRHHGRARPDRARPARPARPHAHGGLSCGPSSSSASPSRTPPGPAPRRPASRHAARDALSGRARRPWPATAPPPWPTSWSRRHRQALAAAGVEVHAEGEGGERAPEVKSALAMALREAVTNVVRHAGARTCRVTLVHDGTDLRLEVVDDGRGGGGPDGNGLRGMRGRGPRRSAGASSGSPAPGRDWSSRCPPRSPREELRVVLAEDQSMVRGAFAFAAGARARRRGGRHTSADGRRGAGGGLRDARPRTCLLTDIEMPGHDRPGRGGRACMRAELTRTRGR